MMAKHFATAALFLGAVTSQRLINPVTRFSNLTLALPPPANPVLHTSFQHPPDCGEQSYKGTGRLKGLKALITGGDSGIGRAIAIAFVREGARVAINYLPEEEPDAQAMEHLLESENLSIERIPGNLLDETFCTELVHEAHDRLGGLDILINHAGVSGPMLGPDVRPIGNMSTESLDEIFRVNVFAPLFLTRAAVPLLPAGGSIVFTTSGIAGAPTGPVVEYGASKAAIAHITRSLAQQLSNRGIRVNAIAPGLVYTPFLVGAGFVTDNLTTFAGQAPYGRLIQPVEMSPHYVDLVDPLRTYISGEIVSIQGGLPGI
ncbi:oxidoreductase [Paramyrothecium foliicola]|nr:oxidoreductase [Paramyrothecium foliicola]